MILRYALMILLAPPVSPPTVPPASPAASPAVTPAATTSPTPSVTPPVAPPVASTVGPPAPQAEDYPDPRPPMIGLGGPELDACGGIGRIGGPLRKVQIYDSPTEKARKADKVSRSTIVWLCEGEGDWQGIVYATGKFQDISDCRVSSPVDKPKPYDGPCQSGWVQANNVDLLAG